MVLTRASRQGTKLLLTLCAVVSHAAGPVESSQRSGPVLAAAKKAFQAWNFTAATCGEATVFLGAMQCSTLLGHSKLMSTANTAKCSKHSSFSKGVSSKTRGTLSCR